jgi:hypothetical protein
MARRSQQKLKIPPQGPFKKGKKVFPFLKKEAFNRNQKRLHQGIIRAMRKFGPPVFPEMGITLWHFTYKLFLQLRKDKVDHIFFCSKEGEFLKCLFDAFQRDVFGRKIIETHYLLVSRKATFICSLRSLPDEDFSRLFFQYQNISLREFLLSLNFTEDRAACLCRSLDLDYTQCLDNFPETMEFQALLKAKGFISLFESTRNEQRQNFLKYLNTFGIDFEKQGLNMVDVGWKGSIQNNIYHTLRNKIRVCGYFLGNIRPTELGENNIKKAILFSDYPQLTPYYMVYRNNTSLFEMILGASHGSADGYFSPTQLQKDVSFYNQGRLRQSFKNKSDVYPATREQPEERALFLTQIEPIQQSILRMNEEINRLFVLSKTVFPNQLWLAKRHARMVFHPKKREVRFFERLYHLENFGLFKFSKFKRNGSLSIKQRYRNLKAIMQNPGSILETGVWPPIILRRLGLEFLSFYEGIQRSRRAFGKKQPGSGSVNQSALFVLLRKNQ